MSRLTSLRISVEILLPLITCILLGSIPTQGAPSTSPTSAPVGGYFSQYFQTATDPANRCAPGEYMTGLSNAGASYMAPICTAATFLEAWSVTGNTGVSNADFLGTRDNQSLRFRTNNTERMVIDAGGNIGIGVAAPSYTLEVNGVAAFRDRLYKTQVSAGTTDPAILSAETEWNEGEISIISLGHDQGAAAGTDMDTKIRSYARNPGAPYNFISIGQARIDISSPTTYVTGNLGIGTSNPGQAIEIVKDDVDSTIRFHDPGDYWYSIGLDKSEDGNFKINYGASLGERDQFTMTTDGKVGLGNSTPIQRLDAEGNIRASGMLIAGNNGAAYFQGGDDAQLWDVNVANTVGIRGVQNARVGNIQLGSSGPTITGSGGNLGIGVYNPGSKLTVAGDVSITGDYYGGFATQYRDDAGLRGDAGAKSGFFQTASPSNYPAGASNWWHLLDIRHSNPNNNYAMQIAGSFFDQDVYVRKTAGSATTAWSKVITSTNLDDELKGNFIQNQYTGVQNGNLRINGAVRAGNWFRSDGTSGWFNETFGGGIYMADSSWIRTYGDKNFYHNTGIMRTDGIFQVGGNGDRFIVSAAGNVGIANTNPTERLDVSGNIKFSGTLLSTGRQHMYGGESLYLLNTDGVIVSKAWGGNGNLSVEGNLSSNGLTTSNGIDAYNAGRAWTTIGLSDDESPNGRKYIHANSNLIGFLNGQGNWAGYWDNNGNQVTVGSISAGGNISGGYILGTYFNSAAGNSENPTIGQIWTQNTSDNYLRKSTPAHFISQLGLFSSTIPSDYQLASSTNGNASYSYATLELRESLYGGNGAYTPPRLALHWGGVVASQIGIESSGRIAMLNNPGTGYEDLIAKDIWAEGRVTSTQYLYSSDRNLKKNITPLHNSLENILRLSGYEFNWKSDNRKDIGLIAQDVELVYPEMVVTDKATGTKAVEYGNLVAPLIEAIKEQQVQIEVLKREVNALKVSQ